MVTDSSPEPGGEPTPTEARSSGSTAGAATPTGSTVGEQAKSGGRRPSTGPDQAQAARRAAKRRAEQDRKAARRVKVGAAATVGGLLLVVLIVGAVANGTDDGGTTVPAPAASERADTVQLLDDAYRGQGVCYGWHLDGGLVPRVSVGSNLGDGVDVESDPRCRRWVKIRADVHYASGSSESNDSASYWVTSSSDLAGIDYDTGLARMGLAPDVFIDDPGWAICRAAVVLPLLVAEAGAAPAAPVETAPAAGQPAPPPLPDPGSDFWRDRWAYLLGAAGLFLVTALLLTIGWFERRHQLAAARVAATRTATGTAGRTASKR